MHSWRIAAKLVSLCLVVLLVTAGFYFTGGRHGARPLATSTNGAGSAPDTERAAPKPDGVVAPKVAVKTQKTAVPAVTKAQTRPGKNTVVAELPDTVTKNFGTVGVTWSAATKETDVTVELRTRTAGTWSSWEKLDLDDMSAGGRPGTESMWVGRADGVAAKIKTASGKTPADIKVVTIDAGNAQSDGNLSASGTNSNTSTTAAVFKPSGTIDGIARVTTTSTSTLPAQPTIILRAAWGARPPTPCDAPRTVSQTKGEVLHHTAGSNSYTKEDSAKIVRGDQAYHMDGHGWCDIGYNFIVDKYGQIFEGRAGGITNQVRGAHSGNNEVNTYAMGVALAGVFTSVEPTELMKDAVVRLIAWRFGQMGVTAKGTWHVYEQLTGTYGRIDSHTLNIISGHRNVVATECPGAMAYAWISARGGLRDRVEDALADPLPAPTGLTVTGKTLSSVSLDWDYVTGAESYHVKASTSTSMSSPIFGTFSESKGKMTGLTPGKTYYFSVVVVDPVRNVRLSAYSAAPYPSAKTYTASIPANLRATSTTTTSLALDWDDVVGAEEYHVKLWTSTTLSQPVYSSFVDSDGTVTGLKPGTKYYFAVVVVDPVRNVRLSGYTTSPYPSASTSSSAADNTVTGSATTSVTFKGHGYGHGIGMGQYGAEGGARDGAKYSNILAHYYPGTALSTQTGKIRVLISGDTTDGVLVKPKTGLELVDISGNRRIALPATIGGKQIDRWNIVPTTSSTSRSKLQYRTSGSSYKNFAYNGSALTWSGDGQFAGPSTISLILPGGSTEALRGAVRSAKPSSGSAKRDTVNVLSIEDYVRGVIAAEVPSSWHAEALKAQAVAARTYGVRSMSSSRYYDICSTTACQVYGGVSRETSPTDSAVTATVGKILTYQGAPALTQFSSSSGGYTSVGSQPYLKAVRDTWDDWSGNANHSWTISVRRSTIERAYASIGTLKSMNVVKRNGYGDMGGRVLSLKIVGSTGTKTITGAEARSAFGLRSDWFGF